MTPLRRCLAIALLACTLPVTAGEARALLLGAQLLGLVDGDAARERELLHRARRELHAAAGGAVGLA